MQIFKKGGENMRPGLGSNVYFVFLLIVFFLGVMAIDFGDTFPFAAWPFLGPALVGLLFWVRELQETVKELQEQLKQLKEE